MNEQCEKCGGLLGVGAPHECDPGEVELMEHIKKDKATYEAKDTILIHANNATIEWSMLKSEHGRMMLPITFVLAMERLDRSVEKLAKEKK